MSVEIDELKLTAYALGELEDDERTAIDAHLAGDVSGRRHVEEVRATARMLADGLARDEEVGPDEYRLTALQHAAIEQRLTGGDQPSRRLAAGSIPLRRNWALWGSIAASVLIVATVTATVIVPLLSSAYGTHGSGTGAGPGAPGGEASTGSQGFGPIVVLPERPDRAASDSRRLVDDVPEWPQLPYAPLPGFDGAASAPGEAGFVSVIERPVSAFPASPVFPDDAGSGALSELKRALARGVLPAPASVRTDALVNAFAFDYPPPRAGDALGLSVETGPCPWAAGHRLVRIGLRAAGNVSTAATSPASGDARIAAERSAVDGSLAATSHAPAEGTPTATDVAARDVAARDVAARDVSVRIEFNPTIAGAYRLIGYEAQPAPGASFTDELPSAAEAILTHSLAPGRTVTALYEVVPAGQPFPRHDSAGTAGADALKYQTVTLTPKGSGELLTVTVRYRPPVPPNPGSVDAWRHLTVPATDAGAVLNQASPDFKLAAAAAEFGLVLRESDYRGTATLDSVEHLIPERTSPDPASGPAALLDLVKLAKSAAPARR